MTRFNMQRQYAYCLFFILGILLISCNEDDLETVEKTGFISVSTSSAFDEALWQNISLTVYNDSDEIVLEFTSLEDVPEEIELEIGQYYIIIKSNDVIGSLFGFLVLETTDMVEVTEGITSSVAIAMLPQIRYINLVYIQDGQEGGDDATFEVTLTDFDGNPAVNDFDSDITVSFSVDDDSELESVPSTVTIPIDSSSVMVPLTMIDDSNIEFTELIQARISNQSIGSILSRSAEALLLDNDEQTYCTSNATNTSDEWIDGLYLEDISNPSGSTTYSDFTDLTTDLVRGNTYTMTVDVGVCCPGIWDEYVRVWIDYNHDGDFFDTNEQLGQFVDFDTNGESMDITFTVPSNAELGPRRMRATLRYNQYPGSCDVFTFGEVEDYSINIVDAERNSFGKSSTTNLGKLADYSKEQLLEIEQMLKEPIEKNKK